jgi:hypothetical protein
MEKRVTAREGGQLAVGLDFFVPSVYSASGLELL